MYNLDGSYCCYSIILVIKGMYNIHDDLVLLFFDIINQGIIYSTWFSSVVILWYYWSMDHLFYDIIDQGMIYSTLCSSVVILWYYWSRDHLFYMIF